MSGPVNLPAIEVLGRGFRTRRDSTKPWLYVFDRSPDSYELREYRITDVEVVPHGTANAVTELAEAAEPFAAMYEDGIPTAEEIQRLRAALARVGGAK